MIKKWKAGSLYRFLFQKVGEAPISIANFNEREGWIDFFIRKVGKVTDEIFNKQAGEKLFLRGPYGNGFSIENFENKHLVIVAGGSGVAPVRPIIEHFYENREKLKSFRMIAGFKDLESVIFKDDFTRWRKKIDVLVTLDKACSLEGICDGLVTKYIPETILPGWSHWCRVYNSGTACYDEVFVSGGFETGIIERTDMGILWKENVMCSRQMRAL